MAINRSFPRLCGWDISFGQGFLNYSERELVTLSAALCTSPNQWPCWLDKERHLTRQVRIPDMDDAIHSTCQKPVLSLAE